MFLNYHNKLNLYIFPFFIAERLIRLSQTQNATIYRVNNLSLESRKDMDGVLLAEKKQLQELEASHA